MSVLRFTCTIQFSHSFASTMFTFHKQFRIDVRALCAMREWREKVKNELCCLLDYHDNIGFVYFILDPKHMTTTHSTVNCFFPLSLLLQSLRRHRCLFSHSHSFAFLHWIHRYVYLVQGHRTMINEFLYDFVFAFISLSCWKRNGFNRLKNALLNYGLLIYFIGNDKKPINSNVPPWCDTQIRSEKNNKQKWNNTTATKKSWINYHMRRSSINK